MAFVKVQIPRTSQPQDACGIDWGNPLTQALGGLFDTSRAVELVYNNPASNISSLRGITKTGRSADFSGTANQQYAHRQGYAATGAMTIFALPEINALNDYTAIIAKGGSTTANIPYELRLGSGSSGGDFNMHRASASGYRAWKASSNIISAAPNVVQSIAVTSVDGSLQTKPNGYVSGLQTLLGSDSGGAAFGLATDNGAAVWIGRRFDGVTQLSGRIYYVAVWNRALSAAEIKSLHDNPWQIFEPEELTIWVPDAAATGGPAAVYSDAYAAYLIRAAAAQDLSASFAIRAATLASLDPAYNVRGSATADQAAAYNIRAAANLDLSPTYNVRGAAQIDLTPAYNLRGLIAKDAAAIYNVRGTVTADITPAYSIENAGTVASDLAAAYGVRGLVQSDASIAYELRGAVQNSLSPAYALRGAVAADLSGSYAVEAAVGVVQSDLTCSYVVDGVAAPCPSAADIAAAVRADLAAELAQLTKVSKIHGVGVPLVVTPTTRTAGDLVQSITTVGDTTTVSAA